MRSDACFSFMLKSVNVIFSYSPLSRASFIEKFESFCTNISAPLIRVNLELGKVH